MANVSYIINQIRRACASIQGELSYINTSDSTTSQCLKRMHDNCSYASTQASRLDSSYFDEDYADEIRNLASKVDNIHYDARRLSGSSNILNLLSDIEDDINELTSVYNRHV